MSRYVISLSRASRAVSAIAGHLIGALGVVASWSGEALSQGGACDELEIKQRYSELRLSVEGTKGPYGVPARVRSLQEPMEVGITIGGNRRVVRLEEYPLGQFFNPRLPGWMWSLAGIGGDGSIFAPLKTTYSCPVAGGEGTPEDYSRYATVVQVAGVAGGSVAVLGVDYPLASVKVTDSDPVAGRRRLMQGFRGTLLGGRDEGDFMPIGSLPGTRITAGDGFPLHITTKDEKGNIGLYRLSPGGALDVRFDHTIRITGGVRLNP